MIITLNKRSLHNEVDYDLDLYSFHNYRDGWFPPLMPIARDKDSGFGIVKAILVIGDLRSPIREVKYKPVIKLGYFQPKGDFRNTKVSDEEERMIIYSSFHVFFEFEVDGMQIIEGQDVFIYKLKNLEVKSNLFPDRSIQL